MFVVVVVVSMAIGSMTFVTIVTIVRWSIALILVVVVWVVDSRDECKANSQ